MNSQFSPTSETDPPGFCIRRGRRRNCCRAAIESLIDHYQHEAQVVAGRPPVVSQR